MKDNEATTEIKKTDMHTTISLELKEKVERMAIQQDRNLSGVISHLIREADETKESQ